MHVIIIGGGAAGIAAAHTLLGAPGEHTVELFEAAGELGGRTRTSNAIPGFAFDMGAQYIQDPAENPWLCVAKELGFTLMEEDPTYDYRLRIPTDNGWIDQESGFYPPVQGVVDKIKDSFETAVHSENVVVAPKPEFDSPAKRFAYTISEYGPISESAEVWQYLASDRKRQREVNPYRNNQFVEKGVGTLVRTYGEQLKTKYGERFTLRLSSPVKQIAQDGGGVEVTVASGNKVLADACIATVPVSVLADGDIGFSSPELPPEHRSALRALQLGSYKKLAIRMAEPSELIATNLGYFLFQDEPEGIWQYYRAPFSPDVLVAHAAGDFALALDGMSDGEVFSLFIAAIEEAYPDKPPRFGQERAITNWTNDPYVKGAYSYTAFLGGEPDDTTAILARCSLAEPVGRVHIAGEATSTDFYGTIAGAYLEGQRAARAVLGG